MPKKLNENYWPASVVLKRGRNKGKKIELPKDMGGIGEGPCTECGKHTKYKLHGSVYGYCDSCISTMIKEGKFKQFHGLEL